MRNNLTASILDNFRRLLMEDPRSWRQDGDLLAHESGHWVEFRRGQAYDASGFLRRPDRTARRELTMMVEAQHALELDLDTRDALAAKAKADA